MSERGRIDVSVLVPTLNEERDLAAAAAAMRAQELEGSVEFLFIDGGSEDGTRELLERLARDDPRVRVLDNPARRTPSALNIGLRHARGEFVARMDAHTHYPPRYLAAGVERLRRGDVEWVSGPQLPHGVDGGSRRVALALSTALGTGGARFRRATREEVEVDSGFTGVWRRATLDAYGGWNEEWANDQDYELAARIRKDGGRIVCIPEMAAGYVPRGSFRALARQYWRYGFYRVKTSRAHPESMRRSHVLPPGLSLAILAALVGPGPLRTAGRGAAALYLAALALVGVRASRGGRARDAAALPMVLSTMHLSAGFGFLWGCLRLGPPLAALRRGLRFWRGRA